MKSQCITSLCVTKKNTDNQAKVKMLKSLQNPLPWNAERKPLRNGVLLSYRFLNHFGVWSSDFVFCTQYCSNPDPPLKYRLARSDDQVFILN